MQRHLILPAVVAAVPLCVVGGHWTRITREQANMEARVKMTSRWFALALTAR
jgi:hypothetical protein